MCLSSALCTPSDTTSVYRLEGMFMAFLMKIKRFVFFFACVSICTNVCCVNILGICIVYIPEMRLNRMIFVVASTILRGVYVWINH